MATPLVLLVDDDTAVQRHLGARLRSAGFEVQIAENGADAIEKVHARPPSLIVLDMVLPVLDGWAFCALRRADPILASIPVVLMSDVNPNRLQNVASVGVLQKPVDQVALLSLIMTHCGL